MKSFLIIIIILFILFFIYSCKEHKESAKLLKHRSNSIHTSFNSLDWEGIYKGVLPK